jgi:hypothetical protein
MSRLFYPDLLWNKNILLHRTVEFLSCSKPSWTEGMTENDASEIDLTDHLSSSLPTFRVLLTMDDQVERVGKNKKNKDLRDKSVICGIQTPAEEVTSSTSFSPP